MWLLEYTPFFSRPASGSKTLPAEISIKALAAVARSPMPLPRDVQIGGTGPPNPDRLWGKRLNQVELWFAKIQRDVIARGVFTSVADLGNKLRKYIRAYSKSARPFRWTYTDSKRRIAPNKIAGTAY